MKGASNNATTHNEIKCKKHGLLDKREDDSLIRDRRVYVGESQCPHCSPDKETPY